MVVDVRGATVEVVEVVEVVGGTVVDASLWETSAKRGRMVMNLMLFEKLSFNDCLAYTRFH